MLFILQNHENWSAWSLLHQGHFNNNGKGNIFKICTSEQIMNSGQLDFCCSMWYQWSCAAAQRSWSLSWIYQISPFMTLKQSRVSIKQYSIESSQNLFSDTHKRLTNEWCSTKYQIFVQSRRPNSWVSPATKVTQKQK